MLSLLWLKWQEKCLVRFTSFETVHHSACYVAHVRWKCIYWHPKLMKRERERWSGLKKMSSPWSESCAVADQLVATYRLICIDIIILQQKHDGNVNEHILSTNTKRFYFLSDKLLVCTNYIMKIRLFIFRSFCWSRTDALNYMHVFIFFVSLNSSLIYFKCVSHSFQAIYCIEEMHGCNTKNKRTKTTKTQIEKQRDFFHLIFCTLLFYFLRILCGYIYNAITSSAYRSYYNISKR